MYVFFGVCALLCAVCVAYFLNADNFGTENYNRDVIQALMLALPAAFAALSLAFAVGSLLRASLRRENEALRKIMADAVKRGERPAVIKKDSGKKGSRSVLVARIAIAVIALVTAALRFLPFLLFGGNLCEAVPRKICKYKFTKIEVVYKPCSAWSI